MTSQRVASWLSSAIITWVAAGCDPGRPEPLLQNPALPIQAAVVGVASGHAVGGESSSSQQEKPEGSANQAPVVAKSQPIIGYNLDFPGDWSRVVPFMDLMRDARPWEGSKENTDRYAKLDLDEHGWPRTMGGYDGITSVIRTQIAPDFAGKTWMLTYRGRGQLTVDGAVQVLDTAPSRIRFVGQPGNVWITLRATDPAGTGDYIRDIQIVREDWWALARSGQWFNPNLVEFLAPYGSLRFMDWALANSQEQAEAGHWNQHSKLTQPFWLHQFIDPKQPELGLTRTGYPVEVLVQLANEVGAHPHFSMPSHYDDEYVLEFARVVKERLRPGLVAAVEYSNEVWNFGFPQATHARMEAEKLWPGEGTGWLQYMGVRASRMCTLWKQVFQGEEHRVRCLIAPQTGWPGAATASLDCPRWVQMGHPPCHEAADGLAITGYFSGHLQRKENLDEIKKWLAQGKEYAFDRAFRQLEHGDVPGLRNGPDAVTVETSDSLTTTAHAFQVFQELARERDLELYVYEGGTHFDHGNDPLHTQFLIDIGRDPRMKRLYQLLFSSFGDAGGTVFNVWGGIQERSAWANGSTLLDRSHPKYRAVVEFVAAHPTPAAARSAASHHPE